MAMDNADPKIETNAAGYALWVLCPHHTGGNRRYAYGGGFWQCGSCNCDKDDAYILRKQAEARAGATRDDLGAWRTAGVV
jgi:hypothetical protein